MLYFRASLSPVDALAAEIRSGSSFGEMIEQGRRDPVIWRDAIYRLLDRGEFDAAKKGAAVFLAAYPDTGFVRTIAGVLDGLPKAIDGASFTNRARKEVQIVERPGAETALLVFTDVNHVLGLPLMAVHRWLARTGASIVYLRDYRNLWFVDGIRTLGRSREKTIAKLRKIIARVGAHRIVCYGNSSGGFSAIQYGAALGADAVVSMAGPTDLEAVRSPKWQAARRVARPSNLRDVLTAPEGARLPVLMVCADGNWDDRLHTDNIADLPNVTPHLVENFRGHAVAVELMQRGKFDAVLDWMMAPTRGLRT